MKTIALSGLVLSLIAGQAAATELTVMTAGDQNMVNYVNQYLAPIFEKQNPGDTVRAVGTGPGSAGSQKILERFKAQAGAGSKSWDTDVAVIHQKFAGPMVKAGYLAKYRGDIPTGKLVTSAAASNALGSDVDGYVMPMFNSQTAIAYNPTLVSNPPRSYAALAEWVAKHPKAFGYNGIKGGMSGVSFVTGWIYAFAHDEKTLTEGPYHKAEAAKWTAALDKLKAFNANVTITPGNAGTLDMLARGEIAMGPVWVDMFYSWKANGRIPPNLKLVLPSPGMPGQPMYYVIPKDAAHKKLAEKFVALATSPEIQAQGIVKKFNWYPGIDAKYVKPKLSPADWNRLFADITPADLAAKGKPFPVAPAFNAILNAYERVVQ